MNPGYGPTVAKRRLSRGLVELRNATGLRANHVCARLGWGHTKLSRIEANAWKLPQLSDVRDLLHFYQAGDEVREELEELARVARRREWWREYGDVFGESEFPGMESDAVGIRVYLPLILPGLLQTPAYTAAQLEVGAQPVAWRVRALQTRARRQEILDRDHPPELTAVVTEASLLYRWGTPEQRRAQLAHLAAVGSRQYVELRLLLLRNSLHPGVCGPINIFTFPGDEPSAVYLETDFAIHEVGNGPEVTAYIDTFARIREAALDAAATTAYLAQLSKRVE